MPTAIDASLSPVRNLAAKKTLTVLRGQRKRLSPAATETLSYGMPAFRLADGKVAAGFASFGKRCGLYPHSGSVIPKLGKQLAGYQTSKARQQAAGCEHPARAAVQVAPAHAKALRELERTEQAEQRRADHVEHDRGRRRREACVIDRDLAVVSDGSTAARRWHAGRCVAIPTACAACQR